MSKIKDLINNPAFRYVFPFVLFMLLTHAQSLVEGGQIFFIYAFKSALTAAAIYFLFRKYKSEIVGGFSFEAVGVGILALLVWLGLTEIIPHEKTVTFDPNIFSDPTYVYLAIAIRIAGASLVVPVMEELIWRSFLMRYLIKEDFLSVKIGEYSHISFWGTVVAFTLVHASFEWLAAFVVGIIYGYYVIKRKDIWGVIIAHGVTNLLLGIYVVYTGNYYYW